MKKVLMGSITIIGLALTACGGSQPSDNNTAASDLAYFQQNAHIFTQQQANEKIANKTLGNTGELALVPLVFDSNGHLITPEEFQSSPKGEEFFTDFSSYKKVLEQLVSRGSQDSNRLSVAKDQYIAKLSAQTLDQNDPNGVQVFDPYRTSYETQKEIQQNTLQKLSNSNELNSLGVGGIKSFDVGDVMFRNAPTSMPAWLGWGHTGMITQVNGSDQYLTGDTSYSNILATEALGPGPGIREHRIADDYFKPDSSQYTYLLRYVFPIQDWQRIKMRNFSRDQIGKPYGIGNLSDESSWYCSKMVWAAFQKIGVEITPNHGYYVLPSDIVNSSYMGLRFSYQY